MKSCYVTELKDFISYKEGLELQKKAFDIISSGKIDGILLLLQHSPVITIGKAGGRENLLISEKKLKELGIELYESTRGGNITYHGPGQLVAYPILNLNKFNIDAHLYLRKLEEVIIRTLQIYHIKAGRKAKYTGVWIDDAKIAAIGVALRRWITKHGFSFNISINKDHFALINPCGITKFGICSLEDFISDVYYDEILYNVKIQFEKTFHMELIDKANIEDLSDDY
ncbi:lipoyl(octanoyl) transferase LipB [Clostridium pasteurianum]|uniref:lipoyl(octanoyl) transferase LipB n=1 Tax=Clostridium pasteurianum TaxID=1501 RepID=UPI002260D7C6|nr:lipoyl(octanoyl) transferase LipB [Clostridium pasteurianum]UZW16201.1 lipoyl(octanoyl) transferase LipB [Clostridium pasteurianum]